MDCIRHSKREKKAALISMFLSFTITFPFIQKQRPELFCTKICSKKFGKIHRKTPVPESLFLIKFAASTLLKKRLQHRCFSVNLAKFLRTPFLRSSSGRLLLFIVIPKEKYLVAHSISSRHLLQVTSLQGNLPQNILEVTHVCSCKTLEKSKKA